MPFDEERPVKASGPRPRASGRNRRLAAWVVDLLVFAAFAAAQVYLGGRACHVSYWLDFVRDTLPLLLALTGLSAVAYSFVFIALSGRTPGMAIAGLRLRTLYGDQPTPFESLLRALLGVASAALGLFGFLLALFDARGQTLHDKLCRCVIRID
jgi:uncharacterized RDD family membrane protein YckC